MVTEMSTVAAKAVSHSAYTTICGSSDWATIVIVIIFIMISILFLQIVSLEEESIRGAWVA